MQVSTKISKLGFSKKITSLFSMTLVMLFSVISNTSLAQLSITSTGTAFTQNFNGMGSTAAATLPTGYKVSTTTTSPDWATGGTATAIAYGSTGTGAVTGTSGGGIINWANGITSSSTDRALGFLTSGSFGTPNSIILRITNNTGSTISTLAVSFDYEKYRSGSRATNVTFFHGSASNPTTSATSGDESYSADANNTVISNPPTTVSKSFNLTGLSIANGGSYYLKWTFTGVGGTTSTSTNSQGLALDNVSLTATASTPTITTTGTLSALSTTYGTASSSTSFTVSGANMTAGILVTPPAGFEVSQTVGGASGYSATQTVGSSGTIASTTIYVRLKADATVAGSPYSGNVVCSSSGATSQNVATVSSTVSAKNLTITGLTGDNKVYNKSTTATFTGTAALNGIESGDAGNVTLSGTPSATFANANVGTAKPITVTGYTLTGSAASNYSVSQPTGLTANITAKNLTITGVTANNKTFDGNTTAILSGTAVLNGIESGDVVNLSGTPTATFASSAVGTNIAVTVTGYTITGTDASNYTVSQPSGLTANIEASGLSDQTITFGALSAVTYGDASFNLTATASSGLTVTYTSSNTSVATVSGNTVTIVGFGTTTIKAQQAGNGSYNPAPDVDQVLTVNKKALTVSGATAGNKEYNGNTSATLTGGSLVGVLTGDVSNVTLIQGAGTGTFASANAGTGVSVTATLSISGSASANYSLTQPTGLSANITAKNLTITGIAANNKQYDGNTVATLNGTATLNGVLAGDVANVTLGGTPTAAFTSSSVATGIAVTVTGYSISGSASGNYTLTQPSGLTANITAKALTLTGLTANNKVYDRTTTATFTGTATLNGVITGEEANVTLDGTGVANFVNATAGNGKTVNFTGYSLTGSLAGNYTLSGFSLTANITQAPLTITGVTANNKIYNANTTATLSGTPVLNGIISGDEADVSVSGTPVATFADSNAGTGIAVTVTGYTLTGSASANYSVSQPTGLTADITQASQTITFNAIATKVFGDPAFTLTLNSSAGLAITYTSSNTAVATVSGNTITILSAGTSTITASQAGNTNYAAATSINQTLTVLTSIAKWTFDGITVSGTATTPTISNVVADLGDQTTGSIVSGLHASASTSWSSATGNGSSKAILADRWASGDYWQFKINTGTYANIKVNWDQIGSATGPRDFKLQYSTNGTSFTDFASYSTPSNGTSALSWNGTTPISNSTLTYDLSAITALNNLSAIYFRLTVSSNTAINGSAIGTGGTSRIDNFTVTGQICTPASFTVTGGGAYCAGGTGSAIGLNGSATGVNYQLKLAGADVGSPVAGTGSAISFGNQTTAGTYTVIATNTTTSCTATMTGNAVVSITTISAPTGSATQTFCNAGTVAGLTATGSAVQWYDAATAGNLLSGSTALVDGNHYYASQTIGGCESLTRLDVTVSINTPSAPTGSATQTFCNAGTVAGLTATGSAIQWYDAATAGNLLSGSTALVNGNHYYASQTISGCESLTRLDVTVSINTPSAPTGTATQTFCNAGTVAGLTATGSAVQWYDAATAGSLLSGSTALVNGNHYYASQTISGCESLTRLDVTVSINTPSAPTGTATQTFCNAGTVAGLTATGSSIQWYDAATAGNLLSGSTALVDGNHYYASQTISGCESLTRLDVTVSINTPSAPTGTATQTFCNAGTVAGLTATGSSIQWYDAATAGNLLSGSTALVNGNHYYASQTISGCESLTRLDVTVSIIGNPSVAPITGISTIQVANSTQLSNVTAGGVWTSDNNLIASVNASGLVTGVSIGNTNIKYEVSNVCGSTTVSFDMTVIANCNFTIGDTIAGVRNACPFTGTIGGNTIYSIATTSANGYTWTVSDPATMQIVSGQNSDSISVHFTSNFVSGTISVTVTSDCGGPTTKTTNLITQSSVLAPASITGPSNVCPSIGNNTPLTYTATPVTNGNVVYYSWTLPANVTLLSATQDSGSITITLQSGFVYNIDKSLKVKTISGCGASIDRSLVITIGAPLIPGIITGDANACPYIDADTTTTYRLRKVANATNYIWTVPAGITIVSHPGGIGVNDTIIEVKFDSNFVAGTFISVRASSQCLTTSPKNFIITKTFSGKPGVITGPTNSCPLKAGSSNPIGIATTYSINKVKFANSYIWTVPSGTTIVSPVTGGGNILINDTTIRTKDTAIIVRFQSSFSGGNISVQSASGCGSSVKVNLLIKDALLSTPGTITGPTNPCPRVGGPDTTTYRIRKVALATFYNWSVGAGAEIFSHPGGEGTANDTIIIVRWLPSATYGAITVTAQNNCKTSAVKSLAILPLRPSIPGTITGITNPCNSIGSAQTYSVAALPTNATSLLWSVSDPVNMQIQGSATGLNIQVVYSAGFTTGTVSVVGVNNCSNSAPRALNIVRVLPSIPVNITATVTATCPNRTIRYSLATLPSNSSSVIWTVPAGTTFTVLSPLSILVSYPSSAFTAGSAITARGVNGCGQSGPTRTLAVNLPACSVAPRSMSITTTTPAAPIKVVVETVKLESMVFPNPSTTSFKLQVTTTSKDQIHVRVLDVMGRSYKQMNMMPGTVLSFGSELKRGNYIVEIIQGTNKTTQQIIKL